MKIVMTFIICFSLIAIITILTFAWTSTPTDFNINLLTDNNTIKLMEEANKYKLLNLCIQNDTFNNCFNIINNR